MIIKAIGCILFAIGMFILLTQDTSDVKIKKIKISVALTYTGLLVLFVTYLTEPLNWTAYLALIVFNTFFLV